MILVLVLLILVDKLDICCVWLSKDDLISSNLIDTRLELILVSPRTLSTSIYILINS